MSKGTFLVIAACFLILSILSFVGGFVVSKAIHESKSAPIIIQHHPSEKSYLSTLEDKAKEALISKDKEVAHEKHYTAAKPTKPKNVEPKPVVLPSIPTWTEPVPSTPTPYPMADVTLSDADPYSSIEQVKDEQTLHNIMQWRQQPYKKLNDLDFSVPAFVTDTPDQGPAPSLDPSLHAALERV